MSDPKTAKLITALIIVGALVAGSEGTRHGFAAGLETGFQLGRVSHAMSVIESQYHGPLGVD